MHGLGSFDRKLQGSMGGSEVREREREAKRRGVDWEKKLRRKKMRKIN